MEVDQQKSSILQKRKRKTKRSHGKRLSKAERLKRREEKEHSKQISTNIESTTFYDKNKDQLIKLLNSNNSEQWDKAQILVSSCTKLQKDFILYLLNQNHCKAAIHYSKRMNISNELSFECAKEVKESIAAQYLRGFTNISNFQRFQLMYNALSKSDYDALQALLHENKALQIMFIEYCLTYSEALHLINQYSSSLRKKYISQEQIQSIHNHVLKYAKAHLSTTQERSKRHELRHTIESNIKMVWPDFQLLLFGSSFTGLCQPNDDLDMCLLVPTLNSNDRNKLVELLYDVKDHLSMYVLEITCVKSARIPVIKFTDPTTKLHCDICINNYPAIWNSILFQLIFDSLPVLKEIACYIRVWAKHRHLIGFHHMLSSYSWLLMLLIMLQHKYQFPLIDLISTNIYKQNESMQDPKQIESHIRTYLQSLELNKLILPPAGEIFLNFYIFWGTEFNYMKNVASLRNHEVSRIEKEWGSKSKSVLSLEDPIEIDRDLGSGLTRQTQRIIRCELVRMCVLLLNWNPNSSIFNSTLPLPSMDESSCNRLKLTIPAVSGLESYNQPRDSFHNVLLKKQDWKISNGYIMGGDFFSSLPSPTSVLFIDSLESGRVAVNHLMNEAIVSMDCEGENLSRTGSVCLIQLASSSHVFIFDLQCRDKHDLLGLIKPLLESTTTMKIVHDCRQDSNALYNQFNVRLNNVFDTQIVHHEIEINQHNVEHPIEDLEIIIPKQNVTSLEFLLTRYLNIHHHKKSIVSKMMSEDVKLWSKRPLDTILLQYASDDVRYLYALYYRMNMKLTSKMKMSIEQKVDRYLSTRSIELTLNKLSLDDVVSSDIPVRGIIHNITKENLYIQLSDKVIGLVSDNIMVDESDKNALKQEKTNSRQRSHGFTYWYSKYSIGDSVLVKVVNVKAKDNQEKQHIQLQIIEEGQ